MLSVGISDEDLSAALEGVDAGQSMLVIDACNSGRPFEVGDVRRGPMNSKGLAQLAYEKGMNVLTASQGYQPAREVSRLGHGLLTYALVIEGLKQMKADNAQGDGRIEARELLDYAAQRVPQIQSFPKRGERKVKREKGVGTVPDPQRPRVFYRRDEQAGALVLARVDFARTSSSLRRPKTTMRPGPQASAFKKRPSVVVGEAIKAQ
jgi:uncharacterized caspase-like protein